MKGKCLFDPGAGHALSKDMYDTYPHVVVDPHASPAFISIRCAPPAHCYPKSMCMKVVRRDAEGATGASVACCGRSFLADFFDGIELVTCLVDLFGAFFFFAETPLAPVPHTMHRSRSALCIECIGEQGIV